MENKICRTCGERKPLEDFYNAEGGIGGKRGSCKRCVLNSRKEYNKAHRLKRLEYFRKYHNENKDIAREKARQKRRERIATDPVYKLKRELSLLAWRVFNNSGVAEKRVQDVLGCQKKEFIEHLKKTWMDKYGTEWSGQPCHIDHIIPLVTAETQEQVRKLFHYSNLRLLTPEDNVKKGLAERMMKRKTTMVKS